MSAPALILAALFLPLAAVALVWAFGRRPNLREGATVCIGIATFAAVCALLPGVRGGARPGVELVQALPGLPLAFEVEPLGLIFALVASGLWIVTTLYSIGYMRAGHDPGEPGQTRFYACFALAIHAAIGIAFARNLFTLFAFYEVLTFSTWPLVTHARTDEARRSGRVYLGILAGTSVCFLLLAIAWTWVATGTLEFRPGGILAGRVDAGMVPVLLGLYVFGAGKAALMPFHRWLPAAMVAPTPVSALLHAVAVVKAGVFTVLKVVLYVFGIDLLHDTGASEWLMAVAAATVLLASLVAMTKDNLKARLAYSTISQLAYIVLGAALATDLGIIGGGMHIVTHAFGKITLFFCAGAIYVAAHKTEISTMNGLGRRMPLTFAAFLVGSLSIVGLPPFGGTWSKWFLALGSLEAGQIALVAVLMVSSLLNVAYLLPIPMRAFFGRETDGAEHAAAPEVRGIWGIREAPFFCLAPLTFTAAGCLALFFLLGPVYDLMRMAVER